MSFLDVQNLNQVACYLMAHHTYANIRYICAKNRWPHRFSTPIQNQCQSNKLCRRWLLVISHGIFFTRRLLIKQFLVKIFIASSTWLNFLLLKIILPACHACLIIKPDWVERRHRFHVINQFSCIFCILGKRMFSPNFLNLICKLSRCFPNHVDCHKDFSF